MEFAIGSRLKELRKTKGMSISELAERSGVQHRAHQSDRAGPGGALRGQPLPRRPGSGRRRQLLLRDRKFPGGPDHPPGGPQADDHGAGPRHLRAVHLLPQGDILDLIRVTLKGGESYSREMVTHEGEECGFVLKGTLTLLLDGKEYRLYEGDSVYFRSTIPHKYLNTDKEDCVSVWAMTPTFF